MNTQNRKSKKIKYGDYFGSKLFFPNCGNFFLVNIPLESAAAKN
jgi:hypothetical protein